jgi:hypothetical protein
MNNWIETNGSPFIIVETINANKWTKSEYKYACDANGFIEKVHLMNFDVLVLGDESLPLKMIIKEQEIFILRWVYAPNEDIIESYIRDINFSLLSPIASVFQNWKSDKFVLFDSIDTLDNSEHKIEFKSNNINWKIDTFNFQKDNVNMIIHRITW